MASAAAPAANGGGRQPKRKATLAISRDGGDPLHPGEPLQLVAHCPENVDGEPAIRRLGDPVGRWMADLATAGHVLVPPQVLKAWLTTKNGKRLIHVLLWVPAEIEGAVSAKIKQGLVELAGVPGGAAAATWVARPCLEVYRLVNTPPGLETALVRDTLAAAGYPVRWIKRPAHPSCPGLSDGTKMELAIPSGNPPPCKLTVALSGGPLTMRLDRVVTALPPLETLQTQRSPGSASKQTPAAGAPRRAPASPWSAAAAAAAEAPAARQAATAAAAAAGKQPATAGGVHVRAQSKGQQQRRQQSPPPPPPEQQPQPQRQREQRLPEQQPEQQPERQPEQQQQRQPERPPEQQQQRQREQQPEQQPELRPEQQPEQLEQQQAPSESMDTSCTPPTPPTTADSSYPSVEEALEAAALAAAGDAAPASAAASQAAPEAAAAAPEQAASAAASDSEWQTINRKRGSEQRSPQKVSPAARLRTDPPAAGSQASPADAAEAAPPAAAAAAAQPIPTSKNRYELRLRGASSAAAPANAATE
jgi:hypothetical protein